MNGIPNLPENYEEAMFGECGLNELEQRAKAEGRYREVEVEDDIPANEIFTAKELLAIENALSEGRYDYWGEFVPNRRHGIQAETRKLAWQITQNREVRKRKRTQATEAAERKVKARTLKLDAHPKISRIEIAFEAWRVQAIRKDYGELYRSNNHPYTEYPSEEAYERLLQNIDGAQNRDYRYCNTAHYPHRGYYREKILPAVLALAQTPAEVEKISKDAIDCLDLIMRQRTRLSTPKSNLVQHFFDEADYLNDTWEGSNGLFLAAYRAGGPDFAKALVMFQARQCDAHYDGLDYSYKPWKMKANFFDPLVQIPETHRAGATQALLSQMEKSHRHAAEGFWLYVPAIVRTLEAAKCNINDYFRLAAACACDFIDQDIKCSQLAILDHKQMPKELAALAAEPEFKDDLIELACAILNAEQIWSRLRGTGITFIDPGGTTDFGLMKVNPLAILHKLRDAGYNNTELHKILQLPQRYPWLGKNIVPLITAYTEINERFPGGVPALLVQLEKMKGAERSSRHLIEQAECPPFCNEEQWDAYLAAGQRLVEKFGDAAYPYFHLSNAPGNWNKKLPPGTQRVFRPLETNLRELIKNPEEFAAAMQQMETTIAQLTEGTGVTRAGHESMIRAYLTHMREPKFLEFSAGLQLLLQRMQTAGIAHRDRDDNVYNEAVRFFAELPMQIGGIEQKTLPEDINYITMARIAAHFATDAPLEGNGASAFSRDNFFGMIRSGVHYSVAGSLHFFDRQFGETATPDGRVARPADVELPVSDEELQRLLDCVLEARAIKAATTGATIVNDRCYAALSARIAKHRAELEALCAQPAFQQFIGDAFLHETRSTVDGAYALLSMRRVLNAGFILSDKGKDPDSPLLRHGSELTRSLIAGATFLGAIGALELKGITNTMPHRQLLIDSKKSRTGQAELLAVTQAKGPIADMLRENLNHIAPRIDRAIMQQRMSMLGLMAVGGKHHARLPIDPNILQTISDIFGLTQTPFHLIHANESLVLAPMPTAFELELMIRILDAFGIIDKLNLQIAGAGRLTNQRAGIVGSTVILSTIEGGIPKPGAFTTTHNGQTGARIMAYDAGIKVRGLPFDIPQAEGRTDKLGSLTTADTMTHQVVHNLMIQEQLGTGPLADLAAEFCRDHGRIMEAHGLRNVVQESAWVYGTGSKDDSLEAHEAMVRRLAETWHAHSMQNRMGVIADMNALVARTIRAILERRDATMDSHPEEVDKLKVA